MNDTAHDDLVEALTRIAEALEGIEQKLDMATVEIDPNRSLSAFLVTVHGEVETVRA